MCAQTRRPASHPKGLQIIKSYKHRALVYLETAGKDSQCAAISGAAFTCPSLWTGIPANDPVPEEDDPVPADDPSELILECFVWRTRWVRFFPSLRLISCRRLELTLRLTVKGIYIYKPANTVTSV